MVVAMVCDDMMGSCVAGVLKLKSGRCSSSSDQRSPFQMQEIIAKILRSLANPRRITKWILAIPPQVWLGRRSCSIEAAN